MEPLTKEQAEAAVLKYFEKKHSFKVKITSVRYEKNRGLIVVYGVNPFLCSIVKYRSRFKVVFDAESRKLIELVTYP